MITRIFSRFFLFVWLFGLSGCVDESIEELSDLKAISGEPGLSLPLINAKIGIKEVYKNYSDRGFVQDDPTTRFLTFVYEDRDSLESQQLVDIPEVSLSYELRFDQGTAAQFNALGRMNNTFSSYAVLVAKNNEKIKRYKIKKGNFIANITFEFKHDAKVVCTYPTITKNGKALIDTINAKYTGTFPFVVNKVINLDGYDVDLSDGGISYNVIPYLFELDLTKNPTEQASTNDRIIVDEKFQVEEYSVIKGYLGKFDVLSYSANERLDIFDKQIENNLFLRDPKILFKIQNSIGMPLTGRISNLRVVNPAGVEIPVTIDQFKDTFTLGYPTSEGQVVNGEYIVDKNNSNIDSIISTAPQTIRYDLRFTANYREEESQDNFLIWDNAFKVQGNILIPLDLIVLKYDLLSSGDFDPPKQDDTLTILSLSMATYSENYIPFDTYLQMYFTKPVTINGVDTMELVDSLFDVPISIPGAIVDANGNVLKPGTLQSEAVIPQERFDRIKVCDKYMLKTRANTAKDNGSSIFVKVYGNQYLNFKAGVKGKVRFIQKL